MNYSGAFCFVGESIKVQKRRRGKSAELIPGRGWTNLTVYVFFYTDEKPNLDELYTFEYCHGVKKTVVMTIEGIGTDYFQFGVCLLDDNNGNRVDRIEKSRLNWNSDRIVSDIMKEWLKGRGRRPRTWSTLLECLRKTRLHTLADNLENALEETPTPPKNKGNNVNVKKM